MALIALFLVFFIAYTIYYAVTLRNVLSTREEYDKKAGDFTANAILEKLNNTDKLKEIALIDKALLEERYYNLLVKSENLKKEKEALQNEITTLKSQLEYKDVKSEGPVAQFRLIQGKNREIAELKEKAGALCSKLKDYGISAEDCG